MVVEPATGVAYLLGQTEQAQTQHNERPKHADKQGALTCLRACILRIPVAGMQKPRLRGSDLHDGTCNHRQSSDDLTFGTPEYWVLLCDQRRTGGVIEAGTVHT